MCRGWTVRDLARSQGVMPTKDAITRSLSRTLPEDSQRVVIETCEREMAKTESAHMSYAYSE